MPTYGIFEDGELYGGQFSDLDAAEEHMGRVERLPNPGAGNFEVKQLCQEHEDETGSKVHGVDECPDALLLHQVLDGLKKNL